MVTLGLLLRMRLLQQRDEWSVYGREVLVRELAFLLRSAYRKAVAIGAKHEKRAHQDRGCI